MPKELHVCGVIMENNKILLIQRSLKDESEPGKWCPINETVKKNESLEKAVVRGVKEEVGVDFISPQKLNTKLFKGPTTTGFIGKKNGKVKLNKDESNDYGWFSYDEAIKLDFAYGYKKLIEDLHAQGFLKNSKDLLLEYLKSQNLMSLAVYNQQLWIATVYYFIDDDFNLYIYTSPKTKHGKMIERNTDIVCNIYDSHQKITDNKVGAQVSGKINQIKDLKALKYALTMWNKVNPGLETNINYKNLINKVISGRIYKITPEVIQFFNEELYPEDEYKIFQF